MRVSVSIRKNFCHINSLSMNIANCFLTQIYDVNILKPPYLNLESVIFYSGRFISKIKLFWILPLRDKWPNKEFFWSMLSRIRTEFSMNPDCIQSEYGKIRTRKNLYSDILQTVGRACQSIVIDITRYTLTILDGGRF